MVRQRHLSGRGEPPRIPWYAPAPDATVVRNTKVIKVGELAVPVPDHFTLLAARRSGLLGVERGDRVVWLGLDGTRRVVRRIPGDPDWTSGLEGRLLVWTERDGEAHRFVRMSTLDGKVVADVIHQIGVAPGPSYHMSFYPAAFLGGTDVAYQARWSSKRYSRPAGYFRTSGLPAQWHLHDVSAVARRARLVAGSPLQARPGECIAVYRFDAPRPLWTRCFTQGEGRGTAHVVSFSPDGRLLLAQASERHGYYAPDRNDIVLLDSRTGRILHRFEYDTNYGGIAFEDDQHLLIVSDDAPRGDPMTESSFDMWVARCSLTGTCQDATERIRTSNYLGYVGLPSTY